MGLQSSKVTLIKESIYPNIYVNVNNTPYMIQNNSQDVDIRFTQRIFFNSRDVQGNVIDQSVLNTRFYSGFFCPQGFRITMLHIGYSIINKLNIKEPKDKNIQYTSKQILKTAHPFVLGMIIQDIANENQWFYIQADQSQNTLMIGQNKDICQFNGQIWDKGMLQNTLTISAETQQNQSFQDQACFHTLIPIVPNKALILKNNNQYQLKQFTQQQQINNSLIGVVYLNKNDIQPLFIYGYDYDLLVFQKQILRSTQDVFYYSEKTMKLVNRSQQFKDSTIQLIQTAFANPKEIPQISNSAYIQIQLQIANLLSGNVTIYKQNLNGEIDSLASDICKTPQMQGQSACSCFNLQMGTSCDNFPLNVQCKEQGYKTLKQLTQKCISPAVPVNYYNQSKNVNIVSAGESDIGNINIGQDEKKTNLLQLFSFLK